jgi:hypothetical protein
MSNPQMPAPVPPANARPANAKPAKRPVWLLAVPLGGLALLSVIWGVGWFVAKGFVEAEVDAALAREARMGREIACAERTTTGFPFRFEINCRQMAVRLAQPEGQAIVTAERVVALAMVWNPTHVIVEATGPATITPPGQSQRYVATWTVGQASLRGMPENPERVSVSVTGLKVDAEQGGRAMPAGTADLIEAHLRRSAGRPGYDVALAFDNATGLAPVAFPTTTGRIQGTLEGLADLRPMALPDRLRQWQQAGGRLVVAPSRVQQGDTLVLAQGAVALDGRGLPDGTIDLTVAPIEQVARLIANAMRADVNAVMPWLSALGAPVDVEGRKAVRVPYRFRAGAMSLGPIPIGRVPPQF